MGNFIQNCRGAFGTSVGTLMAGAFTGGICLLVLGPDRLGSGLAVVGADAASHGHAASAHGPRGEDAQRAWRRDGPVSVRHRSNEWDGSDGRGSVGAACHPFDRTGATGRPPPTPAPPTHPPAHMSTTHTPA